MVNSDSLSGPAVQALFNKATLTGNWVLDPVQSTVELHTRHTWGLRPLRGTFGQVSGSGAVSSTGAVSGTLSVGAASIDTQNEKRDSDLRSGRFFDVDRYPYITFTADRVGTSIDGVMLSGRLTVRDCTRPIAVPIQVSVAEPDEVVLDGIARIDRKEYGLDFNFIGVASMKNTLVIHAVFTRS